MEKKNKQFLNFINKKVFINVFTSIVIIIRDDLNKQKYKVIFVDSNYNNTFNIRQKDFTLKENVTYNYKVKESQLEESDLDYINKSLSDECRFVFNEALPYNDYDFKFITSEGVSNWLKQFDIELTYLKSMNIWQWK